MRPLLCNYHIDYTKKDKTRLIILCLLHELRVILAQRLIDFFQVEQLSVESTVYEHLNLLKTDGLVTRSKNGMYMFYYLAKGGHNYIGGYYTLPRVPEHNLQHHLQVNDYLIKMLELCNKHPYLEVVVSERRKVYKAKDEEKGQRDVKYFVPNFIFTFLDSIRREVEWRFEIELALKTERRYSQGVFSRYVKHLKNCENACLIYVTPGSITKGELGMFKGYSIGKEGDEYKEVFGRLHVFPAEKLEGELERLLEEDKFINWEWVS